jgi:hypothetical protein
MVENRAEKLFDGVELAVRHVDLQSRAAIFVTNGGQVDGISVLRSVKANAVPMIRLNMWRRGPGNSCTLSLLCIMRAFMMQTVALSISFALLYISIGLRRRCTWPRIHYSDDPPQRHRTSARIPYSYDPLRRGSTLTALHSGDDPLRRRSTLRQ